MNKNLLIIGAAIGAYALLRPKTGALVATNKPASSGASTYVPATTPATASSSTQPSNWLNTAVNTAAAVPGLIKTGTSIWGDIAGALHLGGGTKATANAYADVTADGSGSPWDV